ncbi:regulator of chromosome condensation [Cryptosporidium canis]|uniref:Regulator of chromosome condensation n=1 Tax=Cryptosporidium canis TaxID=195482 RepID=A0ABQ8PAP1_9CRYT|nr:regulator of chromosome condensation [Cryptosporidium canis]
MGWRCTVCLVTNDEDAKVCVCCEYARGHDEQGNKQGQGPIFSSSVLSSSGDSCPVFTFGAPQQAPSSQNSAPITFGSGYGVDCQAPGFLPSFGNIEGSPVSSVGTQVIPSADGSKDIKREHSAYFDQFKSDLVEYRSLIKKIPDQNRVPIGTVWVWGSGECDQLGIKESLLDEDLCLKRPKRVESISEDLGVVEVSSGALHNLVLTDQGEVYSWGCNDDGALGRLSARLKAKLERLNGKRSGGDCDDDDEDDDENDDEDDQAEEEDSEKYPNKVEFPESLDGGQVKVKSIICGDCYSCCLTDKGEVYLWGSYKDSGGYIGFPNFQLMTGSLVGYKQYSPVKVPIFGRSEKCSGGGSGRSKKIKLDQEPGLLIGEAKYIVGGENHTIVVTMDERIFAWGSTEFGQFGINPVEDKMEKTRYIYPTEINNETLGLPSSLVIQDIYCGRASTFFVVKDVTKNIIQIFACGRNGRSELGVYEKSSMTDDRSEDPIVSRPRRVSLADFEAVCSKCGSNKPVKQIGGGQYYSALLTCCGEVFIWGMKECCGLESQIVMSGDESVRRERDIRVPTKIEHLSNIARLGFGADCCFAIDSDGVLFVWGMNLTGQIGIKRLIDSEVILNPQIMNPKTFLSDNYGSDSNYVLNVVGGSQHSMGLVWSGMFSERYESEEDMDQREDLEEAERETARELRRMNAKSFDLDSMDDEELSKKPPSKRGKACKEDDPSSHLEKVKPKAETTKSKAKTTTKAKTSSTKSKTEAEAESEATTRARNTTTKAKTKAATTKAKTKTKTEAESESTTKSKTKAKKESEAATRAKTTVTKAKTKAKTEAEAKSATKAKTTVTKAKTKAATTKAKAKTGSESESESATKAKSTTTKSKTKTKTEAESESEAKAKATTRAKTTTTKTKAKTVTKESSSAKAGARATKSESKTEVKPVKGKSTSSKSKTSSDLQSSSEGRKASKSGSSKSLPAKTGTSTRETKSSSDLKTKRKASTKEETKSSSTATIKSISKSKVTSTESSKKRSRST